MSTLEKHAGYARFTFNRPESLNALNRETLESLDRALDELEADKDIHILVVTGAGEKAFVAGADIKEMKDLSPLEAEELAAYGQKITFRMEKMNKIFIAAVNGFALGGGCEMAMACDLVYASESAKFGQPEVNLGVIAGFGGTQRMMRRVGSQKAMDLLLTGRIISAQEACDMGLVAQVFARDEFEDKVQKQIDTLLQKGPQALVRTKAVMHAGMNLDLEKACLLERQEFAMCFASPEQKEGMNAFIEKRIPNFRNQK